MKAPRRTFPIPTAALSFILAAALVGCGGGGDSAADTPHGGASALSAAADFNRENFGQVAQSVSHALSFAVGATVAAMRVHDLAGAAGAGLADSQPVGSGLGHGGAGLPAEQASSSQPLTLPCEPSGHLQLPPLEASARSADLNLAISVLLQQCADPRGWVLDGHYAWTPRARSSIGSRDVRLVTEGTFHQLLISQRHPEAGSALLGAGRGTVHWSQAAAAGGSSSFEAVTNLQANLPGVAAMLVQTRDMKVSGTLTGSASSLGAIRVRADGAASSSAFGHSAWTIRTVEPLVLTTPFSAPMAGHVTITSSSGSRIRMRVLPDGHQVSIELDTDGDGFPDASTTAPWRGVARGD